MLSAYEIVKGLSWLYGGVDPVSGKYGEIEPEQTGWSGAILIPPLGLNAAINYLAEEKNYKALEAVKNLFDKAQFLLIKDVEGGQLTLNTERVGQGEFATYQYPVGAAGGGSISVSIVDHLTWLFSSGQSRVEALKRDYSINEELQTISSGGLGGVAIPILRTVLNVWMDIFYPVVNLIYPELPKLRDFILNRMGKDFYARIIERPGALVKGNLFVFQFHPDYVPKVTKATLYTGVFPISKPFAAARFEGGVEITSVNFSYDVPYENEDEVVATADLLLKNMWLDVEKG